MAHKTSTQTKSGRTRVLSPQEDRDLFELALRMGPKEDGFISEAELMLINADRSAMDWFSLLQRAVHAQIIHSSVPGYKIVAKQEKDA